MKNRNETYFIALTAATTIPSRVTLGVNRHRMEAFAPNTLPVWEGTTYWGERYTEYHRPRGNTN